MKGILARSWVLIAVLILFCTGLILLYGQLALIGDDFASYPTNRHIYTDGRLTKGGKITDRNGVVLAQTVDGKRQFHHDAAIRKATAHTVGDLDGFVATGVHTALWKEVTGYDPVNGVYGEGNDITLTIDASLSRTAYNALGSRPGTVGVYNYKTGEVLCMVSTPTFDPAEKTQQEGEKGVYVNRLLSGSYTPGSVFKAVTALASLEHLKDVSARSYPCKRGVTIGNEWLSCLGHHGEVTLEEALVHSCNAAFSQFALAVGRNNLTATAEKVGFNKQLEINGIPCTKSVYDVKNANEIDFGWSGIGQHTDTVNPFQFLTFMGGIAGEGTCVWPYFVEKVGSLSGVATTLGNGKKVNMMSEDSAVVLGNMMRKAVTDHYGDGNFSGLSLCAKTGTAEIGEKATPHSWFVGFCREETKPYAFVVVVENAGSGLGAASSVASRVLKAAPTV